MNIFIKNIIGNYLFTIFIAASSFLAIPFYIKYMGIEAYGLIGFFWASMLWFNLLDLGFSPLVSRLSSMSMCSEDELGNLRSLFIMLERLFLIIAIVIGLIVFYMAPWFASNWFPRNSISNHEISNSLIWMLGVILLKLVCNLYRASYLGFEWQLGLNILNIFFMALRVMGSISLAITFNLLIDDFFLYQFLVGVFELIVFRYFLFKKIFPLGMGIAAKWRWSFFKENISFSGGAAYGAVVWTLMTQMDKFLLSKKLSLADYGVYMTVVMVSATILQIAAPVYQAIQPRLTALIRQNQIENMLFFYSAATRFLVFIVVAIACFVTYFSDWVLYLFTNNIFISSDEDVRSALIYLCWGNAILVIGTMSYILQLAHGKLRWHVIGVSVVGLVQVPIIFFMALNYSVHWISLVWLIFRLWSLFVWIPFIHKSFYPGFHMKWFLKDIVPIFIMEYFVYLIFTFFDLNSYFNLSSFVLSLTFIFFTLIFGAIPMCWNFNFKRLIINI